MYAVVDIKGFQYKLEKGETLRVPKFETEIGEKVKLSDVMFIADGEKFTIGKPFVEGAVVEATVTSQGKYDKVIVFKKKRRKDYSVKRGHRQDFIEITVDTIKVSPAKKATKATKEDVEAAPKEVSKSQDAEKAKKTVDASEAPDKKDVVAVEEKTKSSAAPKVEKDEKSGEVTQKKVVTVQTSDITAESPKKAEKKEKSAKSSEVKSEPAKSGGAETGEDKLKDSKDTE